MRRVDPGEEIAQWTYRGSGRDSDRAGTGTTQAIHVAGQILRRDVGYRVVIWWDSNINIVALVSLGRWSDRGAGSGNTRHTPLTQMYCMVTNGNQHTMTTGDVRGDSQ